MPFYQDASDFSWYLCEHSFSHSPLGYLSKVKSCHEATRHPNEGLATKKAKKPTQERKSQSCNCKATKYNRVTSTSRYHPHHSSQLKRLHYVNTNQQAAFYLPRTTTWTQLRKNTTSSKYKTSPLRLDKVPSLVIMKQHYHSCLQHQFSTVSPQEDNKNHEKKKHTHTPLQIWDIYQTHSIS